MVLTGHKAESLNRESGVNPEQSRCCKFQSTLTECSATETAGRFWEGFRKVETSQKTCHSSIV